MRVSPTKQTRLTVPAGIGWVVATGGAGAIFATYWDEAWHTDVGRDSAWGAPHVLLYGSVAVVGLAISIWGLNAWTSMGSLRAALGSKSLLLTGAAGLAVLAAAPVDAAWHNAFGRDAVGWSPPHMLVIFGGITLIIGVLSGLATTAKALRAVTGVLLLANAVAVVFEYEADVPQFTELLYLPILLGAALVAATVVGNSVPVRAPVTVVVLGYAGLRIAIGLGLAALGRSTPDLPIAILGLAAFDLPLRSGFHRALAAAMAIAGLAWAASATSLASPAPEDVAITAVPVLALGLVLLLASKVRYARPAALAALAVGGGLMTAVAPARPAYAHDPGQGQVVAHVEMTGVSDARGSITLTVTADDHCDDLTPVRLVARRAGQSRTGVLRSTGPCAFTGTVDVAPTGRWFLYAEFRHRASAVEGWLPLSADRHQSLNQERTLYLPAGEGDSTTVGQVLVGGLIYTVGVGLLGAGILVNRSVRVRALASPASGRI
jgi:hypothetical protein